MSFDRLQLGHRMKANCIKISDCWSIDMLNFDFLEKDLGLASPPAPHFVYKF